MTITPSLSAGQIQIVNGPGKFDVMMSNFDFKNVEITIIQNGRELKLQTHFTFACAEDGSKEKWIGMMTITVPHNHLVLKQRAYYYDSRTRTGHIVEESKKWKIGAQQVAA